MSFDISKKMLYICCYKIVLMFYNGWVYEQVCLAECSNLPISLMANLLIYLVICIAYLPENLDTRTEPFCFIFCGWEIKI